MAQIKEGGAWSFYGSYKDVAGIIHRYHKRGYATKKEAKEAEHNYRASAERSRPAITLDELTAIYHDDFPALGVKESTLVTNESYYKKHVKPTFGKVKLDKITAPMITAWMAKLATKKQKNGKVYAPQTINKSKEVLSKYLSYAMQLGYLEYNPARSVPRFKRVGTVKDDKNGDNMKFWEVSTFEKFIDTVEDPYWNDVFTFLFYTGVREGELFALQWKDIDLKKGTCHICKTTTSKTKENHFVVTSPKTANSIRTIDLQKEIVSRLTKRRKLEERKDGFTDEYYVFGDIAPLSRTNLATHLDKYITAAGVPRITPHGFRHSHASFLIRSGKIDDQLIAERLGHTVEQLRRTYAHIYEESRHDLRTTLDEIFSKNTPKIHQQK